MLKNSMLAALVPLALVASGCFHTADIRTSPGPAAMTYEDAEFAVANAESLKIGRSPVDLSTYEYYIGTVPPTPPAARTETRTAQPTTQHVWVAGAQVWQGGRYVWRPGAWVLPPRTTALWVPGHWVDQGGRHVWIAGRWVY